MATAGRKSKYETHVKPYFKQISEWCSEMTDEEICRKLGVSKSSWCEYKLKYPEFVELLKDSRQDLCGELKNLLFKKARGYTYTETKTIEKRIDFEDGGNIIPAKVVQTETTVKYAHPDTASINLLLKNYSKDDWSNDPIITDIKKQELELKKKQFEQNNW